MNILDIEFYDRDKKNLLNEVINDLDNNNKIKIFTPNPEMLVDAHYNLFFKDILNRSDYNICDGRGVELVSKNKLSRITGIDFMLNLCSLASKKQVPVFLTGSADEHVINKCSEELKKRFPDLQIVGVDKGPDIKLNNFKTDIIYNHAENENLINKINLSGAKIIFVAFGHPKQEYWIDKYFDSLKNINLIMGVGGAFDYISGKTKLAPESLRKIGMEWLFRLILEPRRLPRIYKATIHFLYLFYFKSNAKIK